MSKEKQILLLYAEGCSQRTIAVRLNASRNTVASVIAAAKRAGLQASQIAGMEEKALTALLFPEKERKSSIEALQCTHIRPMIVTIALKLNKSSHP